MTSKFDPDGLVKRRTLRPSQSGIGPARDLEAPVGEPLQPSKKRDTHLDNETTNGLGVHVVARATANPAASTHTNEYTRFEDKAGARDSARVHCPDSQALTATTTPSVVTCLPP